MEWLGKIVKPRDLSVLVLAVILLQAIAPILVNKYMFHSVKGGYSETDSCFVDVGTNGVRIAAIVAGARRGKAALLYCHGNAEDALSGLDRFSSLIESGYTVASVDYPGYGLSDGTPNEVGCYRNAHRLYDWLLEDRGFKPDEIFVVGYSIGTGVAVELASTCDIAGLWLEAPFLSAPRILTRVRLLAVDPFPNLSRIGKVRCPLMILHGKDDEIIPFDQGLSLYVLANDPKRLIQVESAGHTDIVEVLGQDRYNELLMSFLAGTMSLPMQKR